MPEDSADEGPIFRKLSFDDMLNVETDGSTFLE
jgi:hypothetical protein